jgi:hypothetical protein
MKKYQYKIFQADYDDRSATLRSRESELNDFGAEGWELVCIIPLATMGKAASRIAYCFKRPID